MKKYIFLFSILLCGCATSKTNSNVVTILSYEKYTDLYVNDELVGINHTQTRLPHKNIKNTKIYGKKQGCQTVELKADYEFDTPMLLNPFNLLYVPEKYFTWDWWRAGDKDLYNVTPICSE